MHMQWRSLKQLWFSCLFSTNDFLLKRTKHKVDEGNAGWKSFKISEFVFLFVPSQQRLPYGELRRILKISGWMSLNAPRVGRTCRTSVSSSSKQRNKWPRMATKITLQTRLHNCRDPRTCKYANNSISCPATGAGWRTEPKWNPNQP